jgi:hypothetical protein
LTATSDGVNTVSFVCVINVSHPDTVFAGNATLCVDNGATPVANADGCPAGADVANDGDFDNVINVRAANGTAYKRILFRSGKTFSTSGVGTISADGPGYVGSYGAGLRPAISGATSKLRLGSNTNHDFADWRFVDLDFNGVDRSGTGVVPNGGGSKITFLRTVFRNLNLGFNLPFNALDTINTASTLAPVWAEWAIVDTVFSGNQEYGFLGALNRAMFLGNQVAGQIAQHAIRVAFTQKAVISNNELTGTSSGTALTVRGVNMVVADRGGTGNQFTIPAGSFTEEVVISDNKILAGLSPFPFTIKAVQSDDDTRFRYIVVERNWLVAGATSNMFFDTEASEATVRNNIFDLSLLSTGPYRAIGLDKTTGTPAPAANIDVFNNSVFSSAANALSPFVVVDILPSSGGPAGVVVRNNLGFAPSIANTFMVRNQGGGGFTASNNSDDVATMATNPSFTSTPPTQPLHWQPTGGYAVNSGTPVPVFSDFFAAPRTGTYDLGAVSP